MIKLKILFASLICHSYFGKILGWFFQGKIPFRGCRIKIPKDFPGQVIAELFFGIYESAEARFVQQYLVSDCDVVELGSNVGGISCLIARRLSPEKKLLCVEANPGLLSSLRENLRQNAPGKNAKVYHGAIHYGEEWEVRFKVSANPLMSRKGGAGNGVENRVPAFRLSGLLQDNRIGDYNLVCDIEGAEIEILENDLDALKSCKTLIVELHAGPAHQKKQEVSDLAQAFCEKANLNIVAFYGSVYVFQNKTYRAL